MPMKKYTNFEKIKLTSSSGISKTKYQNGINSMLFRKRKLQSFETSCK